MAMKYAEAAQAMAFLSVLGVVEYEQASKAGLTVGGLRVLVRVAALSDTGVSVAVNVIASLGMGQAEPMRLCVSECVQLGLLVRVGRSKLLVSALGRNVLSDYVRAWQRSAKALARLERVNPYPGISRPKERAKAARQANKKKE